MKSNRDRRSRTLFHLYRSLLITLILLGLVFIGGTIYGVFFHPASLTYTLIDNLEKGKKGQGQTFTGIGLLRITTADPQPGTVIISVFFTYYPDDKAFSEELALRVMDFRDIIIKYIGSFSVTELQKQGEGVIKAELLHRFNAILRLGQIEVLYFRDFIIVG